eukprot:tig00020902_g15001.t1
MADAGSLGRGLVALAPSPSTGSLGRSGKASGRRQSEGSRASGKGAAGRESTLLSSRTRASLLLEADGLCIVPSSHWTYPLRPGAPISRLLDSLRVLLAAYFAFAIPFRVAMTRTSDPLRPFVSDWAADVLFAVLCAVRLISPYQNKKGAVEVRVNKIVRRYMKTSLVWDVVAVVPFDVMAVLANVSVTVVIWLRLNRYLATRPLYRYLMRRNENATSRNSMGGVKKLLLVTLLIGHYGSCAFYYTAAVPARHGPDWISRVREDNPELGDDFGRENSTGYGFLEWLTCMFWSFSMLTSMGPGSIAPTSAAEIVAFLLGDLTSLCWTL